MPKDYSYYFVQRTIAFFCVNQIRSELGTKDVIYYVGVCVVDVRQFRICLFFFSSFYIISFPSTTERGKLTGRIRSSHRRNRTTFARTLELHRPPFPGLLA